MCYHHHHHLDSTRLLLRSKKKKKIGLLFFKVPFNKRKEVPSYQKAGWACETVKLSLAAKQALIPACLTGLDSWGLNYAN